MNRTVLVTTLVALTASSSPCVAQASSKLPVVRPTVTELGEFRDTSLFLPMVPDELVLSPRGTLIAYSADHPRIWTVSTHSSRVLPIKFWEGMAWSPAGDAIAFRTMEQDSQEQIWTIRVNPVTGEPIGSAQRVSLTPSAEVPPRFSPDGKSIVFARKDAGEHSSLVHVPAAGGSERVLASGYGIDKLQWAKDGSTVFYSVYQDSARKEAVLSSVSVSGGAPHVVHAFNGESRAPALWANNRLVTLSQAAEATEQLIGDLTGRAMATLALPRGVFIPHNWSESPDEYRQAGLRVATARGVRVINVADGKVRDLIDSTADVQGVKWFEDGRRFATLALNNGVGTLVTMNIDGTGMRKIPLVVQPSRSHGLASPGIERLAISPDGRYAAYHGMGEGTCGTSLELVDLSTGNQRTLTRASAVCQPFWSGDSKTVRYMRTVEGAGTPVDPAWHGVHDVSLDGTDTVVRAFPRSQYQSPTWLIDYNHVSNFRGDKYTLARLDGGPDQLLLRASIPGPGVISADGRTIALASGGTERRPPRKIILLSVADGVERTLDLPFAAYGCGPFSPDGHYLYCHGREPDTGPQTLYEVPVDGSTPRVIARSNSKERNGALALSPDGKWMLETVAGSRRVSFVGMDFTDGLNGLISLSTQR